MHVVAHVSHYVDFYTTLPYPISYGHAMSFLIHVVDPVPHYLVFDTMLPFHSLLSARVSEFGFFHPIW